MRTGKRRVLAAITTCALGGGLAFSAAPAMAQSPPPCSTSAPSTANSGAPNSNSGGTNGGDCSVSGSVSIAETLAFEVNTSSFALASAGTPSATYDVYIGSNDPSGYYVSEEAENANFAGTSHPSNVIPDSDVQWGTLGVLSSCSSDVLPGNNTYSSTSSTSAATVVQVQNKVSGSLVCGTGTPSGMTGYDSFAVAGWQLPAYPSNAPADTYVNTFDLTLWGQ